MQQLVPIRGGSGPKPEHVLPGPVGDQLASDAIKSSTSTPRLSIEADTIVVYLHKNHKVIRHKDATTAVPV